LRLPTHDSPATLDSSARKLLPPPHWPVRCGKRGLKKTRTPHQARHC
jgi:hypothetical protein